MNEDDLAFLISQEVLLTEKMDGSNVCFTKDEVFSRSHSGPPSHKSFDTLKLLHKQKQSLIPPNISVFAEWTYAVHSIRYTLLPSHIFIIGIRDDELNFWWPWDEVSLFAKSKLELPTVPVILRGMFPDKEVFEKIIVDFSKLSSFYGPDREGLVVRHTSELYDADKKILGLGKMVRKNHVTTDVHWSRQQIEVQPTLNYFQKK